MSISELETIIQALRKVEYGDYVLSDDHNYLVDAVSKINEILKNSGIDLARSASFIKTELESIYNPAPEDYYYIWKCVYSKKLGTTNIGRVLRLYVGGARGYSGVAGQYWCVEGVLHTSEHKVGDTLTGVYATPSDLPDAVDYWHIASSDVEEREEHQSLGYSALDVGSGSPLYYCVWYGAYAFYKDQPFTAYIKWCKTFFRVLSLWL